MAVGFDSVDTLDSLWKLQKDKKLTSLIHEILVSDEILQKARVKNVVLVTKLWDDEYDSCKAELSCRNVEISNIKNRGLVPLTSPCFTSLLNSADHDV